MRRYYRGVSYIFSSGAKREKTADTVTLSAQAVPRIPICLLREIVAGAICGKTVKYFSEWPPRIPICPNFCHFDFSDRFLGAFCPEKQPRFLGRIGVPRNRYGGCDGRRAPGGGHDISMGVALRQARPAEDRLLSTSSICVGRGTFDADQRSSRYLHLFVNFHEALSAAARPCGQRRFCAPIGPDSSAPRGRWARTRADRSAEPSLTTWPCGG